MNADEAKRWALIINQYHFLKTRLDAAEILVYKSTLMDRLRWLFRPVSLLVMIDALQQKLIMKERAEFNAAAAKPKIEVVRSV